MDKNSEQTAPLPAPIALSIDELRRVAAGTGAAIGIPGNILTYGGIMVSPTLAATVK